jgi:hypothetical protein
MPFIKSTLHAYNMSGVGLTGRNIMVLRTACHIEDGQFLGFGMGQDSFVPG